MSSRITTETSARKAHWLSVALQEVRKSSSVNLQFEKRDFHVHCRSLNIITKQKVERLSLTFLDYPHSA